MASLLAPVSLLRQERAGVRVLKGGMENLCVTLYRCGCGGRVGEEPQDSEDIASHG